MIRYFAGYPTAANLLLVLIVAAGILATPGLKRETFPRFAPTEIGIEVPYPGAAAADVKEAVCARIDDAVEGVTDLDEIRCEALDDRASATVEMREGGDPGRFLDEVRTEIDAIDEFPDRVEAPIVRERHRTDFVASIALTGDITPADLKAWAEGVKDRLLRVAGVATIDVGGFSDHEFRIEIPKSILRQHDLSIDEVARIVGRQSTDLPGGTIETCERDIRLRFSDERRTPAELGDLVIIGGDQGGEIRLGEIASITDRFEKPEQKTTFNGRRAAILDVHKAIADDSLEVVDALRAFIEPGHLRARFEASFKTVRKRLVGRLADRAVAWRYPFAGLMLCVLVGTGGLLAGGHLGFQAFPDIDGDVVEAQLLMPQGRRSPAPTKSSIGSLPRSTV